MILLKSIGDVTHYIISAVEVDTSLQPWFDAQGSQIFEEQVKIRRLTVLVIYQTHQYLFAQIGSGM